MKKDFFEQLNKTNSIRNDETDEITITVPIIECEDDLVIDNPCTITSNCNALIRCNCLSIECTHVSLSNLTIESRIKVTGSNNFSLKNSAVKTVKTAAEEKDKFSLIVDSSSNVLLSNVKMTDESSECPIKIKNKSIVKIDKCEIGNSSETLIVLSTGCTLSVTNSFLRHTKANMIYSSNLNDIIISNCEFDGSSSPLIYATESRLILKNNKFKNAEQNCIAFLACPLFHIENNSFINCTGSAISIQKKSFGYIKNNSFSQIDGNGIFSDNSEIEISENKINDQNYPAIALANESVGSIHDNEIKNVKLTGIALRGSKYATIFKNEIDTCECGISIKKSKKVLIERNTITNCEVASIESFNLSVAFVKNNIISNIKKDAFYCFEFGCIKAENNQIENIGNSMSKLMLKGEGTFIGNKIKNCDKQCDCVVPSFYYFEGNGDFKGVTNDHEKVNDSVEYQEFDNSTLMCMKCNKSPRNFYLHPCSHKVYCKECSLLALENKEACPLCRFPIEKVSDSNNATD